jgi:hypothetical protein
MLSGIYKAVLRYPSTQDNIILATINSFAYAVGVVVGSLWFLWPVIPIMVIVYFVATKREKASEKKRIPSQD